VVLQTTRLTKCFGTVTAVDNLRALALASGGVPEGQIDRLLRLVGLTERAGSAFKTYSLGMKQRLGIASTLLMDPALVILDEPTNGLDPAGQREVRDLIPQLAREGRAVLLASHLLHEVEQICDRVAIIRRGKLIESGTVSDLLRRQGVLVIEIAEPERAAALVRELPFVEGVTHGARAITVQAPPERGAEINQYLAGHGLWAATLIPRTSSLEDIFLELTDEGAGSAAAPPR
jgi:ABC-2 type transport system ATP-binding protein